MEILINIPVASLTLQNILDVHDYCGQEFLLTTEKNYFKIIVLWVPSILIPQHHC